MSRKLKKIVTVDELEKIIERSNKKPVFIFKHDETSASSLNAYDEYVDFAKDSEEDILFTIIYIKEDMELSDAVEELLDVTHETPQLILVIEEEAVWDDKDDKINAKNLIEVVEEFVSNNIWIN